MAGFLGIVICVLILDSIPGITVLVVNYLVLIELCIIMAIKPYKSSVTYRITLFNMFTQLSLTFLLLYFTEYGTQEV